MSPDMFIRASVQGRSAVSLTLARADILFYGTVPVAIVRSSPVGNEARGYIVKQQNRRASRAISTWLAASPRPLSLELVPVTQGAINTLVHEALLSHLRNEADTSEKR